jgi:DNA-binding transcriptional LysR family regulator
MSVDNRVFSGVDVLAAVVECGSFVKAAEALGLTQPGVSRAIARLESRVGIRLLDRTTRSVSLTAEGKQIYEDISPLLARMEEVVASAAGSAQVVRGRLRVNVAPNFSHLILAPKIGGFLERYPEVSIELVTGHQVGDLIADGFDAAIRFVVPSDSSLIAHKLLETRVLTVASPSYLKKHGRPKHPRDLENHSCIHYRDPNTGRPFEWELHQGNKVVSVKPKSRLLLTEPHSMFGACVAGAGIAQVLAFDTQHLVENGQLIDLFPDWPGETFPLYVLYPSRNLPPAKLRAFVEFISQAIEEWTGPKARTHTKLRKR